MDSQAWEVPRLYPRIVTQLCPRTLSRLCPRWIVLSISMYCLWTPFRLKYPQVCLAPDDLYVIIPTPPHPLVLSMLKSVLLLTGTLSSPPHPTPPHPCRYNWAQILDFVGTSETNTCRYKWVKSVGASEPLPLKHPRLTNLSLLLNLLGWHFACYVKS